MRCASEGRLAASLRAGTMIVSSGSATGMLVDRQIRLHKRRLAFALVQSRLISLHRNPRRVAQLTILQSKWPIMPGADRAAIFDHSSGEIAAGVRTVVVHY